MGDVSYTLLMVGLFLAVACTARGVRWLLSRRRQRH
jgi:hypothetical protein